MKRPVPERVDVSMEALEAILEQARSKPLCEEQIEQLRGVLNNHRLKPVGLNNGLKVRIRVA